MEVRNPPFLEALRISLPISQFLPKFTASARSGRSSYRFRVSSSRLDGPPPTSIRLPVPKSRNLPVSAKFARRRTRRNFLRKKLIDNQKVRIDNPDLVLEPTSGPETLTSSEISSDDVVRENEISNVTDDNGEGRKRRLLGESALWNKVENWVDQYKNDVELWGIGSNPIFTVVQDSNGNVKRVTVDEDEILKRSGLLSKNSKEVSLKILRAKSLAREVESGNNVIPRNSSVATFIVAGKESGLLNMIQDHTLWSRLSPKLPIAGRMVLYGSVAIWALSFLLGSGKKKEAKNTQMEKVMVRRKIKAREDREMLEKGRLEVVPEDPEPSVDSVERPKLNREELMKSIRQADSLKPKLVLPDHHTISNTDEALEMNAEIEEIREMAARVREIEASKAAAIEGSVGDEWASVEEQNQRLNHQSGDSEGDGPVNGSEVVFVVNGSFNDVLREGNEDSRNLSAVDLGVPGDLENEEVNVDEGKCLSSVTDSKEVNESLDLPDNESNKKNSVRRKPRIILSVKEAREYLSIMPERKENIEESLSVLETGSGLPCDTINGNGKSQRSVGDNQVLEANSFGETNDQRADPEYVDLVAAPSLESLPSKEKDLKISGEQEIINHVRTPSDNKINDSSTSAKPLGDKINGSSTSTEPLGDKINGSSTLTKPSGDKINGSSTLSKPSKNTQNWIEENFDEVEPIVEKIGAGFRDNYMAAREKVNQNLDVVSEMSQLQFVGDEDELEWMKDDNLQEIVFQVRENELAGRDPFYSMDVADKRAFFEGLEKKVVRENEKLQNLHEFLHSNIENLDYGADGISLYDPPEKIIPRWKGPPTEKDPEFLKSILEEREAFLKAQAGALYHIEKDESTDQELKQASNHGTKSSSSVAINARNPDSVDSKKAKTVIEGSDGSVKAGKKSGKEYWQHTKKWSRGFLDSYNAEADPEVKSVMKDIGKDLDRWITEKEIQEAADLMNKLPERNKKFIEKKLDKVKREMELFGPQAVVSKYKEYAEDEGEDYLWWLDLPHVLCIELYTMQDGEQKVGFYSLEMAADLELEPKPYHVIAFEDPGDCKNLCYIIQAHMEMLGNGHAFVVARPPKDAFRETKANGFGVTVIRKGELALNIDQTLEEVEEQISEIGSKVYHDAIMKDRSVDISALMKGVFGVNGKTPRKRRSKRKLKKPRKSGR